MNTAFCAHHVGRPHTPTAGGLSLRSPRHTDLGSADQCGDPQRLPYIGGAIRAVLLLVASRSGTPPIVDARSHYRSSTRNTGYTGAATSNADNGDLHPTCMWGLAPTANKRYRLIMGARSETATSTSRTGRRLPWVITASPLDSRTFRTQFDRSPNIETRYHDRR